MLRWTGKLIIFLSSQRGRVNPPKSYSTSRGGEQMPESAIHITHNWHLNTMGAVFLLCLAILFAWNALPDIHNDHSLSCFTSFFKHHLLSGDCPDLFKDALPLLCPILLCFSLFVTQNTIYFTVCQLHDAGIFCVCFTAASSAPRTGLGTR